MVGNANANGVPFIKNGTSFLKDNIVLWYDLKRQGATNETMKANPILKDLSGHGHDATCYNFAWSGMSGVGGYIEDFKNAWYNLETEGTIDMWSHNSFVLTSTAGHNTASIIYTNRDNITLKFKVSGLTEGDIIINQRKPFERVLTITEDGIYEVQLNRCGITSSTQRDSCNIKIELIPEYPNALVSDGVDDYAYVEGLPLLTDCTAFIMRDLIDIKRDSITVVKGRIGSGVNGYSITVDRIDLEVSMPSYNFLTRSIFSNSWLKDKLIIGSPTFINGWENNLDRINDEFDLLHLLGEPYSQHYAKAALYSFILFDRTLTDEEIKKWIRQNMDENYLLPNERQSS